MLLWQITVTMILQSQWFVENNPWLPMILLKRYDSSSSAKSGRSYDAP